MVVRILYKTAGGQTVKAHIEVSDLKELSEIRKNLPKVAIRFVKNTRPVNQIS